MSSRKGRWMNLVGLLVLLVLLASVGFALFSIYGNRGKQIELTSEDAYGLMEGAPLRMNGVEVGKISKIQFHQDQNSSKARIMVELVKDAQVEAAICRSSTEFSIARFINTELQWKDAQTVLHGSYLVAESGDPAAPGQSVFETRRDPPRDQRIAWNSIRVTVLWKDAFGLAYGAPVMIQGNQAGCVDGIKQSEKGVEVVLAFFTDFAPAPLFPTIGTKFYIRRFQGENLEVHGVETLVHGSQVVVIPGDPEGEKLLEPEGSIHPPPDPRVVWSSPRCVVDFSHGFGLQVGARILCDGIVVGQVEQIDSTPDRSKVHCVFFDSERKLATEGARFYVSRFSSDRLEVHGVESAVKGTSLVLVPGTGETLVPEHSGYLELPPDPRVKPDSPRLAIFWNETFGLEPRAPVYWQGVRIGEVETIDYAVAGKAHKVSVVMFYKEPKYRFSSNRFFVNSATLGTRGVQGDPSTVLKGAHIDLVLDPLGNSTEVEEIRGFDRATPRFLPESGEVEMELVSRAWVEPDTPVVCHREVVGYVHRCQRATNNVAFISTVRVYRRGKELIRRNTVFFLPPRVQASLLSRDGWAIRGPRIEVPDLNTFLQAGIELRTPTEAAEAGDVVDFRTRVRFSLHAEPKAEWLGW